MNLNGWLQILTYALAVLALTKPVGVYLHRVFEAPNRPWPGVLGRLESWINGLSGVDPSEEQSWKDYAAALLLFSLAGTLATYVLLRVQHLLPLNPQGLGPVSPHLAFNTAVSFVTNTNWQSYAGESTMSYFSQMAALAWHNFMSAASGMGVALALARGMTRREAKTVGNFWADMTRCLVYVLLPVCLVGALFFVSQGVIQNVDSYVDVTTLEGAKQTLPMGPVASQEVIKIFGINGGGFFNANSAHPFENPTPLTNFVQLLLMFALPAGATYMYGLMSGDRRQGWMIFGAMMALFLAGAGLCYWAEVGGGMEGKEARFGTAASALYAAVTTGASCGAVNAMHDSFTALGGLVPLANILLGEVVFGGVGAGLYGMLMMAVLSVFIAGLMVGRTPEFLGKKIEAREMMLVTIYILVFPLAVLVPTAWASVHPPALASLNNAGPHGLSEILYAFASAAGNNGSAFAGLNANTPWWNTMLGLSMLAGRFWMMAPVLALAGSLAGKKSAPPGPGTFPTNEWLFAGLLAAVVVVVGGLTYFPSLSLGPVVEHFLAGQGRTF